MTALRAHWDQMSARDRRILLIGGVAVTVLLLYALVWDPLMVRIAQTEASVASQRSTLAWMQQAAGEARALRGNGAATTGGNRSLLAITDETAKAHNLGDAVKRVQPDGQHTVRVTLEGAAFDDVLRWLDTLAGKHGIQITGFSSEAIDGQPGRVNARLVLETKS